MVTFASPPGQHYMHSASEHSNSANQRHVGTCHGLSARNHVVKDVAVHGKPQTCNEEDYLSMHLKK
eukprot:1787513-Amphidinium_carterae.2